MSTFLDPVTQTRLMGLLYILSGLVMTLLVVFHPVNLFFGLLNFIIGFGLIKRNTWVVYLIGVLIVLYGLFLFAQLTVGHSLADGYGTELLLSTALFFWLYSAIVLHIYFSGDPRRAAEHDDKQVPPHLV